MNRLLRVVGALGLSPVSCSGTNANTQAVSGSTGKNGAMTFDCTGTRR